MTSFKNRIRKLKKLFISSRQESSAKSKFPSSPADLHSTSKPSSTSKYSEERSVPHYIQVGFDFGTGFSKCVYRDINTNNSWIYIPEKFKNQNLPFLLPSILKLDENIISHINDPETYYLHNSLFHIKWALKELADHRWNSDILKTYKYLLSESDNGKLANCIKLCATYYLAGNFGEIRKAIFNHFNDFGINNQDYMAINMGIPVAFAENDNIKNFFYEVLCNAWLLADELVNFPPIDYQELESYYISNTDLLESSTQGACFLVPEVSANLQGFVKSRVSRPGLYLFSDTGAATVDQSIFTFVKRDYEERLNYFYSSVLPLGSSHLELEAARKAISSDQPSREHLEEWRAVKEKGYDVMEMNYARNQIAEQLANKTKRNLSLSRRKLYLPDDLENIKVIFGGGGHCDYPYKQAVLDTFLKSDIFRKSFKPDIIGVPNPKDLVINQDEHTCTRWMPRLSVAYGLSFAQHDVAANLFPHEIDEPQSNEVCQPRIQKRRAPTKDEC